MDGKEDGAGALVPLVHGEALGFNALLRADEAKGAPNPAELLGVGLAKPAAGEENCMVLLLLPPNEGTGAAPVPNPNEGFMEALCCCCCCCCCGCWPNDGAPNA